MAVTAMTIYTDPDNRYALHGASCWPRLRAHQHAERIDLGRVRVGDAGSGCADPVRLKWFNITMAVLLVLSLWPMLR
jgi:hypothetical protein